jgi:hypothetical protein
LALKQASWQGVPKLGVMQLTSLVLTTSTLHWEENAEEKHQQQAACTFMSTTGLWIIR